MDTSKMASAIVNRMAPPKGDDTEEKDEGPEASEGAIAAAEDIMDCLSSYSGASPSDSDSKVEKATKEAARRAKAKILAGALKAFLDCCGDD